MSQNDRTDNDNDDDDRPRTPAEEDCCGSGCTPCIFDVHRKLLDEWRSREMREVKTNNNLLSALSYKVFTITNISEVSEGCITIRLEHKERQILNNACVYLAPGQYIMLHSGRMSRPYTPIAWTHESLSLLVRVYECGEFSTRLRDMSIGSTIDVRGPYGDFKYESNSFRQIIMFGIGSGIAALYPIAKAVVDNETESTRIHLITGFRSMAHVPLKKELRLLADYWNFKCTLQLSQLNDKINLHGFDIKAGRLSKSLIADYLRCNDVRTTLILICGTSKFNQSMREWIQEMNYAHIHVFN